MKDIFLSIFKTSEERLKNPFVGTFILSFLAFNWKPIIVLFLSNKKIENRIGYIVKNYSQIETLLYFPLIMALVYIIVLPYFMWLFESITFKSYKERNQNLYKSKLVDIDGKKSVALSEIELENLKADYKEKADLNNQINSLKNQLSDTEKLLNTTGERIDNLIKENNDLKTELVKKESTIDELYNRIDDSDIKIKNYYDDYKNTPRNTIHDFVDFFNKINTMDKNDKSQYLLDRFISQGLVKVSNDEYFLNGTKTEYYELTEKGLYFIRKANLDKII